MHSVYFFSEYVRPLKSRVVMTVLREIWWERFDVNANISSYNRAEQRKKSLCSKVNLHVEELCKAGAALESTKPRTDYHFGKRKSTLFKQITAMEIMQMIFFSFFTQAGWKQWLIDKKSFVSFFPGTMREEKQEESPQGFMTSSSLCVILHVFKGKLNTCVMMAYDDKPN